MEVLSNSETSSLEGRYGSTSGATNSNNVHNNIGPVLHREPLSDRSLRLLFLIMGMGTLFVYNAFISCIDYFNAVNEDARNLSGQMVAFQLASMLLVTICLLPFSTFSNAQQQQQHRVIVANNEGDKNAKSEVLINTTKWLSNYRHICALIDISSPSTRVLFGFSFTFLFLFVFLFLPPPTVITLNIFSVFIGIADATSQSGLYILAANYGNPSYSAAAVLGAAVSGLIVSLLRLITRAMFDTQTQDGLRKGALLLIGLSFGFCFFLIAAICAVKKDSFFRFEESKTQQQAEEEDDEKEGEEPPVVELTAIGYVATYHTDEATLADQNKSELRKIYSDTLKIAWKPIFLAFLNFFITLSLFPGVIVSITSSENGFLSFGDWLPLVLITVFNLSDCIGRYMLWFEKWWPFQYIMAKHHLVGEIAERNTGIHEFKHFKSVIWWPTFMRIIFFPLFAICIIPAEKPYLHSDFLTCVIVFLFGLSNGFIQCATFTVTPTVVKSEESRNAVSLMLLLAIFMGLTLGACFGLLVEMMIWILSQ